MRFIVIGKTSSMKERKDVTQQIELRKKLQKEADKKAADQSSTKQAVAVSR
jgi:hypothetical protein